MKALRDFTLRALLLAIPAIIVAVSLGAVIIGADSIEVVSGPADHAPLEIVYDEVLKTELLDRSHTLEILHPAPLKAEMPYGTLEAGTCRDFVGALRDPRIRTLWGNDPKAASFAECIPLHLVMRADKPKSFLSPASRMGETIAGRLDLRTLPDQAVGLIDPADLRGLAARGSHLSKPSAEGIAVGPRTVDVALGESRWRFEAMASADFSGLGVESLIVRITRDSGGRDSGGDVVHRETSFAALSPDGEGGLRAMPLDWAFNDAPPILAGGT